MRTRAFACCVVSAAVWVGLASAAPGGVPARIMTLGSWRTHDPADPQGGVEPWRPADVAGFLERYPTAYMDLGYRDATPAGNWYWRDKGRQVDELQRLLAERGIDALSRICVTERPDVMSKLIRERGCDPSQGGAGCDWEGGMDGSFGEQETIVRRAGRASSGDARSLEDARAGWEPQAWRHRLLVLRPGMAGEERRRIVGSTDDTLDVDADWQRPPKAGDPYEIRGSFDPRWVKRVPRATHDAAIRDLWLAKRDVCGQPRAPRPCAPAAEPLDPWNPANRRGWPDWLDRRSIEALVTPSGVPALYGPVQDARRPGSKDLRGGWSDPFPAAAGVVMDLANPAYRDWRIRYLMYKLRDYGLDPGEPACIKMTYKPGWYAYYDEATHGPSGDPCAVPGSGLWTGPAHVCADSSAPGGPLVSGLYGPHEFERGINAYLRELIAQLSTHGWEDLRLILVERPTFTTALWTVLDEDIRRHPKVIGEWQDPIEPRLAELRERQTPAAPVAKEAPRPSGAGAPKSSSPLIGGGDRIRGSGGKGGRAVEPTGGR